MAATAPATELLASKKKSGLSKISHITALPSSAAASVPKAIGVLSFFSIRSDHPCHGRFEILPRLEIRVGGRAIRSFRAPQPNCTAIALPCSTLHSAEGLECSPCPTRSVQVEETNRCPVHPPLHPWPWFLCESSSCDDTSPPLAGSGGWDRSGEQERGRLRCLGRKVKGRGAAKRAACLSVKSPEAWSAGQ